MAHAATTTTGISNQLFGENSRDAPASKRDAVVVRQTVGKAMLRPYDQKTGGALYEKLRWRACGVRKPPKTIYIPLTLAETLNWARRIPHSARKAQGFTRIIDFARHVRQLRAKRAELRRRHPDPIR